MTTVDEQWFTFFDEAYLRIYTPFLSNQRTEREVKGITQLLNLPLASSLLDLCCGYGRLALPLAKQGYRVTGQDINSGFLQHAKEDAEALEVQANWHRGDMRSIPWEGTFDAVINVFSSFGYFEQEEDNQRVLQQVHKALKPGGLFLLETMHQNRLVRSFSPSGFVRYEDGLIVLEERRFDLSTSRNEVHITMLHPDGSRSNYSHSMRVYTPAELIHMLAKAGLQVQALYGDLDGSALTLDSRFVAVSQKRE